MLTVLHTANLRGDLVLLPRLYTFLRRLRQEAGGRALLLDAGNACADETWHCAATGGRSALLVLDAMGYQAANVTGFLTEAGRQKLAENLLGMALVDETQAWETGGILVTAREESQSPHEICIVLRTGDSTRLDHNWLSLADVQAGQVGVTQIGSAENGELAIQRHEILTVPPTTPPDPTIAATVDFVLSEARYYQKQRGNNKSG